MAGKIITNKEDWIVRGMIMGIRLVIDGTEGLKNQATEARQKAKKLEEALEDE